MVLHSGTKAGRDWFFAPALVTLEAQVNAQWPDRNKASDGSIASPTHTLINPSSDHEPRVQHYNDLWVVTAIDLTDDDSGADMDNISEAIRVSKDPRVKYVIKFRGTPMMYSSYEAHGYAPYTWRPYSGTNPHKTHGHISTHSTRDLYMSTDPWSIGGDMAFTPQEEKLIRDRLLANSEVLGDLAYAVKHRKSDGAALGFLIDDARKDIITRAELNTAIASLPKGGATVDEVLKELANVLARR